VLYIGQAVGSAIGGLLFARDLVYGVGYAAMGFVAVALTLVVLSRPRTTSRA
jgi:predicted MFS family arabinose efflux permease